MSTPITSGGAINSYDEYYLANDIVSSTFPVLTVNTYCRINGNGKQIRYTGTDSDSNPSVGIQINAPSPYQVNISGGLTFSGVRFGILSSSPYTRIQYGVDFSGCRYCGASLGGHDSWVQYCLANGIGGVSDNAYAIAVNVSADNCLVDSNQFTNIYRQAGADPSIVGEGCPIILNASCTNGTVTRNFIENDTSQTHTIGVFAGAGGFHTVQHNNFVNYNIGIQGGPTSSSALTLYRNQLWMKNALAGSIGIKADYGTATDDLIVGYSNPISGTITLSGNTTYP